MKKWVHVSFIGMAMILVFGLIATTKTFIVDSDVFWHLKLGDVMAKQNEIVSTAIGTYGGDNLPYVSHEVLFQCVIHYVHAWFGWTGMYLLFTGVFVIFMAGIYALTEQIREEMGLSKHHPYLHLFLVMYSVYIFFTIVQFKVIALSIAVVVWYVVWLKRFIRTQQTKPLLMMAGLSWLLANLHGGTWIIVALFYLFAMIDALVGKTFTIKHIYGVLLMVVGGIFHAGGIQTIFYAWEVGPYKEFLKSFQPVLFADNEVYFACVVLFIISFKRVFDNSWFDKFFLIGLLYLALSSRYQFYYFLLFLPYVVAIAVEGLPFSTKILEKMSKSFILSTIGIGMIVVVGVRYIEQDNMINPTLYPVDEYAYIQQHESKGTSPKVLAQYGESGYLMYKGARVLADPRLDPFITDKTKGVYQWNAFERQKNAFLEGFLIDELTNEPPDYLLVPYYQQKKGAVKTPLEIRLTNELKKIGEPVFKGRYGYVYRIH